MCVCVRLCLCVFRRLCLRIRLGVQFCLSFRLCLCFCFRPCVHVVGFCVRIHFFLCFRLRFLPSFFRFLFCFGPLLLCLTFQRYDFLLRFRSLRFFSGFFVLLLLRLIVFQLLNRCLRRCFRRRQGFLQQLYLRLAGSRTEVRRAIEQNYRDIARFKQGYGVVTIDVAYIQNAGVMPDGSLAICCDVTTQFTTSYANDRGRGLNGGMSGSGVQCAYEATAIMEAADKYRRFKKAHLLRFVELKVIEGCACVFSQIESGSIQHLRSDEAPAVRSDLIPFVEGITTTQDPFFAIRVGRSNPTQDKPYRTDLDISTGFCCRTGNHQIAKRLVQQLFHHLW